MERSWANMIEEEDPNFFKPKSRSRSKAIEPRAATAEAKAYGRGEVVRRRASRCPKGSNCPNTNCTFFHGEKECNFAAGKQINTRRWLPGGKPNPQKGKKMTCRNGSHCKFNHRSATRRASTEKKIYEKARLEQAPVLLSEADLVAAYPSLEYKAADAWSTDEMSPLDKKCLMASLKKSPAEFDEHGDYIDIRFPNGSRSRSKNKN
jgi:hypothetical protein